MKLASSRPSLKYLWFCREYFQLGQGTSDKVCRLANAESMLHRRFAAKGAGISSKPKIFKRWSTRLYNFSLALVTLAGVLIGTPSQSKDLANRLGVGISNIGALSKEAVSLDWQLTNATGFEVNFALATQGDENGGWDLGFRASRNIFIEDNMLFSLFVGGGLLQSKTSGTSATGYLIETGLGAKFFFEGLPNLGFGFRGSFQVIDVNQLTLQIAPIFSVHYYF